MAVRALPPLKSNRRVTVPITAEPAQASAATSGNVRVQRHAGRRVPEEPGEGNSLADVDHHEGRQTLALGAEGIGAAACRCQGPDSDATGQLPTRAAVRERQVVRGLQTVTRMKKYSTGVRWLGHPTGIAARDSIGVASGPGSGERITGRGTGCRERTSC